ncbi:MAG: ATP synthase F0 subunit B [Bdellovibrionota bacterium]
MSGPIEHIVTAPGIQEFFSLMNVGVVVLAVLLFARKGIAETFKSRSQKLRSDLVETREELKKITQEIELSRKYLADIESEKKALIQKVEEEGKLLAARLVDEAKLSADRIKEDSDRAVSAEFAEMFEKLRAELLDAIISQTRNEFESENPQQKLHERLIEGFINQSAALSKETQVNNLGHPQGGNA